ncbi:PHP domain-containing protein [Christensenellaceae bacterium OttesenSCG-928-K19]|nr:PHP domain-containing protein [Christensenellaceae bacterium OttesenSCG-928-K19]
MKLFQSEMHCHTMEVSPCSRIPARYIVRDYAELGYRYLFITDHYHPNVLESFELGEKPWEQRIQHFMKGYRAAAKEAQGTGLSVLMAMEVVLGRDSGSGIGSDFLVYGFDEEFLLEYPYLYRYSYADFYSLIKEKGYLAFQAHPYRYGLEPVRPICYDGIEIVNTHPRHESRNKLAVNYALDNGLYMIGGSDTHSEEDIGRGGIMLPEGIESPMDIVDFYREKGSPELIVTFGA